MKDEHRKIEVCFSPVLFNDFRNPDAITVIVDILRATSAIVTAFMNGVSRIIPVETLEQAADYKRKGYMVAAERDGLVQPFADFGNSPFNFTRDRVEGKHIVYSTTNGTQAIHQASECFSVVIGAYLNFSALCEYLIRQKRDIIILCAAWKNKFNLEDTLFSGAIAERILQDKNYYTICDSTLAAIDLFQLAKTDLLGYIDKAAQRHRLRKNKLDDVIEYCHTYDLTTIIPVLKNDYLIAL
ncbi:MAG: 2-phosphosulfolactate phosphatase [Bacteroides sp. SM23_62_1]|nr:MAG: 2-phosphosulfolactate phosphatase [Bacteroides sp. SM23_62_1]